MLEMRLLWMRSTAPVKPVVVLCVARMPQAALVLVLPKPVIPRISLLAMVLVPEKVTTLMPSNRPVVLATLLITLSRTVKPFWLVSWMP